MALVDAPNVSEGPSFPDLDPTSESGKTADAVSKWGREVAIAIRTLQNKQASAGAASASPSTPAAATLQPSGLPGLNGSNGWSPMISLVTYAGYVIMKVVGWTGGSGAPPASGVYIGNTGFVTDPALALNVQGTAGAPGGSGVGGLTVAMNLDANNSIPPPTGYVRINVLNKPPFTGFLYVSTLDRFGIDVTNALSQINIGSVIKITSENILTSTPGSDYDFYLVSSLVVNLNYVQIGVTYLSGHGIPVSTTTPQSVQFSFSAAGATSGQVPRVINVKSYGAVGDGVTDDTAAIWDAIIACRVAGGIDRVYMTNFGTGYTSVPAVGFTGGKGSGAVGTALLNQAAGAAGAVGTVAMTTRGSGYIIYGKLCALTSGNTTILCSDTSGLVAGLSADHPVFPANTVINSIVPNVSVTLNNAPGANSPFAQVAFGIPRVTFTGGGGTGAAGDVIVGDGVILYFPPGTYLTSLDVSLTGMHNLSIEARGATIFINTPNANGLVIDEFSRGVEITGLKIEHISAVFSNWSSRAAGCGMRIAGSLVTVRDVECYNSAEFGILFSRDRTTGTASYGNRVINLRCVQTCGDALHFSNGCGGCDVVGVTATDCGDDNIAIVADFGAGNEPANITINNFHSKGSGWRGIALLGAKNVQVGNGIIENTMGFGLEMGTGGGSATCADILIENIKFKNIGTGGNGTLQVNRHAMVLQNCTGLKVGNCFVNTCTGYGYLVDNVTDAQIDYVSVLGAGIADFNYGTSTFTRFSHTYKNAGALTYRGTGGTVTVIAPA